MGQDFENPFGNKAPKSGRIKMMSELLIQWLSPAFRADR